MFSRNRPRGQVRHRHEVTGRRLATSGARSPARADEKLHQHDVYRRMPRTTDRFKDAAMHRAGGVREKGSSITNRGRCETSGSWWTSSSRASTPRLPPTLLDGCATTVRSRPTCRVNRLDGEDKEYGYIIDYKDSFNSLEGAIADC